MAEILHPIPAIPETMNVTDLMNRFSRERKSIAWIIDEFGGTAGIVTMEDLLEEIFGEIEDEYDTPESQLERKISEQEYTFSGRIKLNYLTEKFGFVFPDSDNIETLSGYLIETHGSIPAAGEKIIVHQLEFEIQEVKETRIETIHLKLLN
jgi:CBS domain containing-hemolysin-like protein